MAVPHAALRPPPVAVVRRGDRSSLAVPRITAPLSWLVLAAVVVGLAVGALACAAGLAGGSGHRVHALRAESPIAPVQGSHRGHIAAESDAGNGDSLPGPAAPWNDGRSESTGTSPGSHPGMACVVTVNLDVAESVTPAMAGWFDSPGAPLPGDCVGDLDPPVPRHS